MRFRRLISAVIDQPTPSLVKVIVHEQPSAISVAFFDSFREVPMLLEHLPCPDFEACAGHCEGHVHRCL